MNGEHVPAYCVPVFVGETHSFSMIDTSGEAFPLKVELVLPFKANGAVVLPATYQITPALNENRVSCRVDSPGKYTFILNDAPKNAFTLFVRAKQEAVFERGYKVIRYRPGLHYVNFIDLKDNTILFLESGALLIAKPPCDSEAPTNPRDWSGKKTYRPFIRARNARNVKILGKGLIDFTGLDSHARSPIAMSDCDNVVVEGVTLINSPSWNITADACRNVSIKDVIVFGYRINSDGIVIANCVDVRVSDCFIRSGDDLFGVKSLRRDAVGGRNIRFSNCIAWADKVRCFGVTWETKSDIRDVHFTDCCVLYSLPTWTDELGSLVIIVGDRGTVSDVYFKNIEIFAEAKYPINCSISKNPEWALYSDKEPGMIKNIYFENIRYKGNLQIRLRGVENAGRLDGVHFKNIYRDGKKITSQADLRILGNEFVGKDITIE